MFIAAALVEFRVQRVARKARFLLMAKAEPTPRRHVPFIFGLGRVIRTELESVKHGSSARKGLV